MEENVNLDLEQEMPLIEVPKPESKKPRKSTAKTEIASEVEEYNCLRNERVVVRYIPKQNGNITNPKHILYGGMSENAVRIFTVPKLSSSGTFVNVLTNREKNCLESIMGLEHDALSIYKKPESENFWNNNNPMGINRVRLTKQDNYLDLSIPEDYIKYKILLANKDFIAPSLQILQDKPKVTYQFVIISEGEETTHAKQGMSITMECYKEYGKIEDNKSLLRAIVELIDGRPTAPNIKIEFLQTKINELIQANSKMFLRIIKDPLLGTKSLIMRSIEAGYIARRGDHLYLRADNSPLCGLDEEPTLTIAAKFLNSPKNQELKFSLEAKLKDND